MIQRSVELASFTMVTLFTCIATSAPAPKPGLPSGHEEWVKTRLLPKTLHLNDENGHNRAIISTPNVDDWPGYSVVDVPNARNRRELRIGEGGWGPLEKSTYMPGGYVFNLGDGDVVPLFDQIYSVEVKNAGSKCITLNRVTDRLPKEFRPGLHTRTICTAAVGPMLFWEQNSKFEKRQDYDSVELKFDPVSQKAELQLYPTFTFSHLNHPLTEEHKVPNRERLDLQIKKGELLTARGRSYKVLNVVPPQDIEGIGHLVGWIELAADPEPAPK